jgi:hypothetical protein
MEKLRPHFFMKWLDRSKENKKKSQAPGYQSGYWDGVADGFEAGVLTAQQQEINQDRHMLH